MGTFMSSSLEVEVSTKPFRFVSDSRVVQIKGERMGITGSANRLSSVFQAEKWIEEANTHTQSHTPSLLGDRECVEEATPSADWHFESASNVLKLHVTFVRLILVPMSHCEHACLSTHKHLEHTPLHRHTHTTFANTLTHSGRVSLSFSV